MGISEKYLEATAKISECGKFRYELSRQWRVGTEGKFVLWCMLNPSTADGESDDPTIRKCVGFSKKWGYGALVIVNVSAYRATDPRELKKSGYQVEPENRAIIRESALKANLIIAAWGNHATSQQVWDTFRLLRKGSDFNRPIRCLGKTKRGMPKHPLYVPYETPLEDY